MVQKKKLRVRFLHGSICQERLLIDGLRYHKDFRKTKVSYRLYEREVD
ncbi:MAG: hypothetical protein JWP81_318 [Ferruginibacter sp.]|nr:hypothetical protein [Ferruginibacter sp.]